jgi:hypothetical protein
MGGWCESRYENTRGQELEECQGLLRDVEPMIMTVVVVVVVVVKVNHAKAY